MKKILVALAVVAFGASALQQARGQDVSVDYFYNNLSGGNWIDVEGYGYGWQPDIAANDPDWRPYADGYWAYTDDGWTWISYEEFGWATYHYGRWANLSDYGWVWFPGTDLDWGPAWVSWRTGGDYVGWAPLPPRGPGVVYEGGFIGPQVDIQFDIGPAYYNFIPIRYIGEPVLRNYIVPPVQNVTYINNTVNVTNINVQNNVVYNRGPDYNALAAQSARPIQRLSIERQSAANLSAAAAAGTLTKVQGNKLVVAAPPRLAKAPPAARPAAVKTKVAQPKVNRGWAGVPNEAQLKQKIKTENPKNVPPPAGAVARGAGPAPVIRGSPAVPAAAAAPVAPGPKGKPGRVPPGARPTPAGAAAATGAAPSQLERGKRPGAPGERPQPPGPVGAGRELGRTPVESFRPSPPPPEQGRPPSGFGPVQQELRPRQNAPEQGRGKTFEPERRTPPLPAAAPAAPAGAREPRGGPERGQPVQPGVRKPPTTPPAAAGQGETRGGQQRGQGEYGQPGGQRPGGAPPAAERGQGQPERGKKKGEGTPPPGPR